MITSLMNELMNDYLRQAGNNIWEVDLPGYSKEEIDISFTKDIIWITADNKNRGRSQYTIGSRGSSCEDFSASFINGVLRITRKEDASCQKKTKIPIQ